MTIDDATSRKVRACLRIALIAGHEAEIRREEGDALGAEWFKATAERVRELATAADPAHESPEWRTH